MDILDESDPKDTSFRSFFTIPFVVSYLVVLFGFLIFLIVTFTDKNETLALDENSVSSNTESSLDTLSKSANLQSKSFEREIYFPNIAGFSIQPDSDNEHIFLIRGFEGYSSIDTAVGSVTSVVKKHLLRSMQRLIIF